MSRCGDGAKYGKKKGYWTMCEVEELTWKDLALITVNSKDVFVNDALSGDRVKYELRGTVLVGTKKMSTQADGVAIRTYMFNEKLDMYLLTSRYDNISVITVSGEEIMVNDALPKDAHWERNQDLLIGMASSCTRNAKIGMSVYTQNARLGVFVLKSTELFELRSSEVIVFQIEGKIERSRKAA